MCKQNSNVFNNAFHIKWIKINLCFNVREAGLLGTKSLTEVAFTLNIPWGKAYVNRYCASLIFLSWNIPR